MSNVATTSVVLDPPVGSDLTSICIEDLLCDVNDAKSLRALRDDIIMDEKIDKRSALLISSLCSASELMLLDLQFRKDKEIQEARHELALLHTRVSEREMLQSLCNDVAKLTGIVQENEQKITDLDIRLNQFMQQSQMKKK